MVTTPPERLYKVWPGSNRFLCSGRLIFGPDVASLFLTMFMIAGPAIAFCYQIAVKIHKHGAHLDRRHMLGVPVLIGALIVTVSDLVFLVLTSSRDPGIVPRNEYPPEEEGVETLTSSMEWISERTPRLTLPRTKLVVVNGFSVRVKFCETCLLYRPPRASHCSICNNCVQKFDHHCPWVGQCIGLRNYRFFFFFISTSTFLCIYVFTFSWINILLEKHNYITIWLCMKAEVFSVVLITYTFLAIWFVGGLTIFHSYLMSRNQTTYENFRYRYDKKDNPYNKGSWSNIKDVFFTKIPPSLNDFRSWVQEEIVEVGSFTSDIGMVINSDKKLDIDMGGKPTSASGLPIPSILQNIDYHSTDDNLSDKGSYKDDLINPFATPVIQELTTEALRDGNQSYSTDGQVVDEGADKTTLQNFVDEGADQTTLQNFVDDNLSDNKHKEYMINPFAINVIQESIAQESRDCNQIHMEDGHVVDQEADQMILNETTGEYFYFVEESPDRCSYPSEILHPVDRDIHSTNLRYEDRTSQYK